MQSLISYLSANCNLHFESLVADFIKSSKNDVEDLYFIGIIAYRFDLEKMTNRTINLHPFTLSDDPTRCEVSLP